MAHQLPRRDRRFLESLDTNKTALLEEFRATWSRAEMQAVREELGKLERYLAACSRSEVDDTLDNIVFMRDKASILRELLEERS